MMTTLEVAVDVPAENITADSTALHGAWLCAGGEETKPLNYRASDSFFGSESECAADARLVKRLSLVVVPMVLLLCLLTLALAQVAA
jgi:hypothetical protein